MIQLSSQDTLDKQKGIFSGLDEAVPSRGERDSWSLSVWHLHWTLDNTKLEIELRDGRVVRRVHTVVVNGQYRE